MTDEVCDIKTGKEDQKNAIMSLLRRKLETTSRTETFHYI